MPRRCRRNLRDAAVLERLEPRGQGGRRRLSGPRRGDDERDVESPGLSARTAVVPRRDGGGRPCLGQLQPFVRQPDWQPDYGRFRFTVPAGWMTSEDNADGYVLQQIGGAEGTG